MKITAVVDVVSYELNAEKLMELLRIPESFKAVPLPMCTPDGLPNHVQLLLLQMP